MKILRFLIILIFLITFFGCDKADDVIDALTNQHTVKGRVTNHDGESIQGMEVKARPSFSLDVVESVTTDSDGRYSMKLEGDRGYSIDVYAPGSIVSSGSKSIFELKDDVVIDFSVSQP